MLTPTPQETSQYAPTSVDFCLDFVSDSPKAIGKVRVRSVFGDGSIGEIQYCLTVTGMIARPTRIDGGTRCIDTRTKPIARIRRACNVRQAPIVRDETRLLNKVVHAGMRSTVA